LPPHTPPTSDAPLAGDFTVTFNGEESQKLSADGLVELLYRGEETEAIDEVKRALGETLSGRPRTISTIRAEASALRNESAASVSTVTLSLTV